MQTLSEIVQSALKQVDEDTPSVKLASAADVPEVETPEVEIEPADPPAVEKVATVEEILDDGAHALKLAQCLEVAAGIVKEKLAAEASDAVPAAGSGDNAVGTMEATDNKEVSLPPASKGTVESSVTTNAATTAGPMPDSEGDHTGNPDWTNNKEAADAAINEKLEQAALLEGLGETEKSAELLEEAEKIAKGWLDPGDEEAQGRVGAGLGGALGALYGGLASEGRAADMYRKAIKHGKKFPKLRAASVTGAGAATGGLALGAGLRAFGRASARAQHDVEDRIADKAKGSTKRAEDLSTSDEGIPSHAPSNEEAISLTKAVAKKRTQMEAAEVLQTTPGKDPAIEASLAHTEVAKVSSLLNAVKIRGYAQ